MRYIGFCDKAGPVYRRRKGRALSIRYIFGRAGSGKSHLVLKEISEWLNREENRNLILIVPEQFTLQAERNLIEKLHLQGFIKVEVLSFTRLALKVFDETGGLTRVHINEQGKHMVLRKVLDEVAEDLTVFQHASKQKGFVTQFNELICQLKRYDISPEDLAEKASRIQDDVLLPKKLADISIIYEKFNRYLQERYIDTEDAINHLAERMEEAEFLKGAVVWLDGFDSFTPQTYRIIEKLMGMAHQVNITLTMDYYRKKRDRDLFLIYELCYKKLHEMAVEKGIPEETVSLSWDASKEGIRSPEIAHIEKEFYAYPYQPYEGEARDVELFAGMNLHSEVENMAAQMMGLARDRGYRWHDMAVVCADLENYGSLIRRVFDEYGIPCFLDQKRPVLSNPIVELVLASLAAVQGGYRYEDVFRLLKTGFSGLEDEEVEVLENYCLEFGIRGDRWKKPFTLAEERYDLEAVNQSRERLMLPLEKLEKGLGRRRRVEQMVKALYDYLEEIRVQERLEAWIEEFRQRGLYEYVDENAQIWNILMDIFDQMVEILGDQQMTLKEFNRVLESGFASQEVGIIPTTIDQVLVGNIQRSKSHDIKALFVVGCNDGILPSGKEEEGILGEEERTRMKEVDLYIGGDRTTRSAEEAFSIYSAFCKPTEFLWVSYALADQEGRAMRPSILIDRFKKLLPGIQVKSDIVKDKDRQLHLVATADSTFKYLVENLRCYVDQKPVEPFWWNVYRWYREQDEWRDRGEAVLKGLFHKNQVENIGQEHARKLYNAPIRSSVSRLEQFVNCPFAHFIRYGLRLRERRMFTVEAPDMGELFHSSIEKFTQRLRQERLDWRELDQGRCERMIEEIMEEIVPDHNHGVLLSTNRYRYLVNRLKRISSRAVWTLTDHVKRSGFQSLGHEVSFGLKGTYPPIQIDLPNGERVYLEGRIDRVDILEGEDAEYVKIIDYKSGDEDLNLSDVYHGLKLQLLVYLYAMVAYREKKGGKPMKPAGIFYFKIDDPLVDTQEKVKEAIEREIRKKLKMKGLVLKDAAVVREMDREIDGYSDILPVGLKKDGSFYANSSAIEEEDFFKLMDHVQNLIREISMEMIRGNIRIQPVKNGKITACRYCPYTHICQFDRQFQDNTYRNIRNIKGEEIFRQISGKEGGKENATVDE
jgi:ATP-dependent helicase/nuclease subunit B